MRHVDRQYLLVPDHEFAVMSLGIDPSSGLSYMARIELQDFGGDEPFPWNVVINPLVGLREYHFAYPDATEDLGLVVKVRRQDQESETVGEDT